MVAAIMFLAFIVFYVGYFVMEAARELRGIREALERLCKKSN